MRELPVELARAPEDRPGLQFAVVDLSERHYLAEIAGGKDLVGVLEVAVGEAALMDSDACCPQQLDRAGAGDAAEEAAVRGRRMRRAILADPEIGRGELGHMADGIQHHAFV